MAEPVPVTILTGFLGSGKTTLLKRLLQCEGGARTAVLINEFGEIGLDHLIVRSVSPTSVVLQNGCVCCTIRTDLQAGLRELVDSAARSSRSAFNHIILETTGLADPVPVVQTLIVDPMLRHQLRLRGLVATVDGLQGLSQLATQEEAHRQAATADRLVLTKTDIADPNAVATLCHRLAALNPTAPVIDPSRGGNLWDLIVGAHGGSRADAAGAWLARLPDLGSVHRHGGEASAIRSFVVRTEEPIDWTAFAVWLSALVHRHGRKLLRVKGLLAIPGVDTPVLLNAVQSFVHPPMHLEAWPDADRSSRLVFITHDLDPDALRGSLTTFLGLSNRAPDREPAVAAASGLI